MFNYLVILDPIIKNEVSLKADFMENENGYLTFYELHFREKVIKNIFAPNVWSEAHRILDNDTSNT